MITPGFILWEKKYSFTGIYISCLSARYEQAIYWTICVGLGCVSIRFTLNQLRTK